MKFDLTNEHKDIIGTIFLALGIIMLGYMLVSPFNNMIIHVDEFFTISVLNFPITDLITVISHDVHPPFHYLLLKIVSDIAGIFGPGVNKLFIYKIVSIIPYAIILVLSATKIKNRYGYFTAGLFAFTMAVMSEFLVNYTIVRMYSWAMLFVILAFIFLRDVIDNNDPKSWGLLTLFSVLAAYTHYFAAIPIVCIYLCLLIYLYKEDKEKLKYWGISVICGIVLFAPWIFALFGQVTSVSENFWIPEITFKTILGFLGYFVTASRHLVTGLVAIVIFIILLVYTARRYNEMEKKDRFYMTCGLMAYLGTIIIGTLFSVLVKPIMVDRYLLPSAAILWFAIAFMLGKIEDKKVFIISFVLVLLLIAGGISKIDTSNNFYANSNMGKVTFFDQISQDNNSIVINDAHNRMFYMQYANDTEMYLLNPPSQLYGYDLSEVHDTFNFKEVSKDKIPKLIKDNKGKNIYILSLKKDYDKNINTTVVLKNNNFVVLKVNN